MATTPIGSQRSVKPSEVYVKKFFFHFNKPASQRAGTTKFSVHIENACHIVDGIVCHVPTQSKARKRQPRAVMVGRATSYSVRKGVMTLK